MSLFSEIVWLKRMYDYLYSRYKGTVRTVNNTAPDTNGNVNVSGGGGGTLQEVTDAGNFTSNAIQVTGLANADPTKDGAFIANVPVTGAQIGAFFNGGTIGTQITFNPDGNWNIGSPSKRFLDSRGTTTPFSFTENSVLQRVSGADGTQPNDFVTFGQIPTMEGGLHTFVSDGVTDNFTIPHNLTTVKSHYVTRNQDPGGNLIGTEIAGPNILVTFVSGPPLDGLTIIVNWGAFGTP